MTIQTDERRRALLRVLVKALALGGLLAFVLALLASLITPQHLRPNEVAYFDPRSLAPGEAVRVDWDGRPVFVLRRTPAMLEALSALEPALQDPGSRRARQPEGLDRETRSRTPQLLVVLALGTGFGCPLDYVPPDVPRPPRPDWVGGFVERCGDIPYDPAGRVYRHPQATRNLDIPPYVVLNDGRIAIGYGQ
ncbi:hypothetical protein HUS23_12440 [Ectothiorhodospiraceae bacterium 2226]|nr:hypothetical protein HUS23_12440 [Ectothiorhodospiraceae bacterium 2226]